MKKISDSEKTDSNVCLKEQCFYWRQEFDTFKFIRFEMPLTLNIRRKLIHIKMSIKTNWNDLMWFRHLSHRIYAFHGSKSYEYYVKYIDIGILIYHYVDIFKDLHILSTKLKFAQVKKKYSILKKNFPLMSNVRFVFVFKVPNIYWTKFLAICKNFQVTLINKICKLNKI